MVDWKKIPMKFPGTCIVCNEKILDETAFWAKGLGVQHEKCFNTSDEIDTTDKLDSEDKLTIPKYFTIKSTEIFKIIDDSKLIEIQQSKMEDYFKSNPSKFGKIRLTQRGTTTYHSDEFFPVVGAYFNSKYDVWWSNKIDPTYKPNVQTRHEFEQPKAFKNVFGIGEPNWKPSKRNSHPIMEINYNKDGSHTTAGFILEKNGSYFLGITKTIGGNYNTSKGGIDTHKGKIEKYFSDNNVPVIKSPKPIFLIAEINQNFIETLSKFIKNIKKIKDILIEHDLKDINRHSQTTESTYFFDNQYEKGSMHEVIELEKLKYSKTELDQEINNIDSETESKPKKQDITTSGFVRNPRLSNILKIRFKHTCQICEKTTFKNKEGYFYTESHHILPLSLGGEDKSKNIIIVCANCHRKFDSGHEDTLIETYKKLQEKQILSILMLEKLYECKAISKNMFEEIIHSN